MDHPAFFSATLGLSHPWQVTSVSVAKGKGRLDISVEYAAPTVTCPHCGAEAPCQETQTEIWVHRDFLRYHAFLHARVPQVGHCPCGRELPEVRPWCRPGSLFSLIGDGGHG